MAINYLTTKIRGLDWKVYVQTPSAYSRKHGNDSKAVTYPDDREMWFDRSHARLAIIKHEVAHAFFWSTDTEHNSEMSAEDLEDLFCTVYGNNSNEMARVTEEITDFILKGK